jgi:hypothetical protein
VEYRRVQSWRYALGVALGLRPRYSLRGLSLPLGAQVRLAVLFWITSALALMLPVTAFDRLRHTLYRLAKSST